MEPAGGAPRESAGAEALLGELEARVQEVVRASSWWERHGVDCAILALSLFALPPGEGHGDWGLRGPLGGGGGCRGRAAGWDRWRVPGTPGQRVSPESLVGES